MIDNRTVRNAGLGKLPASAPLASAYVPMQCSADPTYDISDAFSRGTLFPGLDLPFMNIVNNETIQTPASELQAICFAAHELLLYLDTHKNDKEAFDMFQNLLALRAESKARYVKRFGPLIPEDMLGMNSFVWTDDPWPWDYRDKKEG